MQYIIDEVVATLGQKANELEAEIQTMSMARFIKRLNGIKTPELDTQLQLKRAKLKELEELVRTL